MPAQQSENYPQSTLKMEANSSLKKMAEKDLLVWETAERPFKRRDREFYVTVVAMAAIVALILFLVDGWAPVILIIALVFLFYVMSTIEPGNLVYKFTNRGVVVGGKTTEWHELTRFWFTKRFDSQLVVFETINFPGRMELVISPEVIPNAKKILSKYLLFEEVPASSLDKAANWFSKRLPGN